MRKIWKRFLKEFHLQEKSKQVTFLFTVRTDNVKSVTNGFRRGNILASLQDAVLIIIRGCMIPLSYAMTTFCFRKQRIGFEDHRFEGMYLEISYINLFWLVHLKKSRYSMVLMIIFPKLHCWQERIAGLPTSNEFYLLGPNFLAPNIHSNDTSFCLLPWQV